MHQCSLRKNYHRKGTSVCFAATGSPLASSSDKSSGRKGFTPLDQWVLLSIALGAGHREFLRFKQLRHFHCAPSLLETNRLHHKGNQTEPCSNAQQSEYVAYGPTAVFLRFRREASNSKGTKYWAMVHDAQVGTRGLPEQQTHPKTTRSCACDQERCLL